MINYKIAWDLDESKFLPVALVTLTPFPTLIKSNNFSLF